MKHTVWLLDRQSQQYGSGTMIDVIACAHAPVDIIALGWEIIRHVAFVAIAHAAVAGTFAAAIIIGNDVITPVRGVFACAYPGHRRHFGPRRATGMTAATTGAQETVHAAVTPVFAFPRIAFGS